VAQTRITARLYPLRSSDRTTGIAPPRRLSRFLVHVREQSATYSDKVPCDLPSEIEYNRRLRPEAAAGPE